MKKLIFTFFATMCLGGLAFGQIQTPAPSPSSVVKQKVGLTDVEINYSRPSMKDRQVFGNLVPYGEMWRTGANASTKISFSNDVRIDGKEVKAGTYALFSIPGVDNWTIILHKNTNTNGVPNPYKEEEEAVRLTVPAKKLGFNMESMLINVNNLRNNSATIELMWENTLVGFEVDFGTDALVQANIDRVLAGPTASDYYRAARYYREENKDLVQALGWIRKANDAEPRYWTLLLQAELEAELMQYEAALASAERSKELAMKDNDMNYVRRNEALIAEVKAKLGTKQKEPVKTLKNSKSESKM
jgi:hypothetical protein